MLEQATHSNRQASGRAAGVIELVGAPKIQDENDGVPDPWATWIDADTWTDEEEQQRSDGLLRASKRRTFSHPLVFWRIVRGLAAADEHTLRRREARTSWLLCCRCHFGQGWE